MKGVDPHQPTEFPAASKAKIALLRLRAEREIEMFHPDDNDDFSIAKERTTRNAHESLEYKLAAPKRRRESLIRATLEIGPATADEIHLYVWEKTAYNGSSRTTRRLLRTLSESGELTEEKIEGNRSMTYRVTAVEGGPREGENGD